VRQSPTASRWYIEAKTIPPVKCSIIVPTKARARIDIETDLALNEVNRV
jgi:hypothetical protein